MSSSLRLVEVAHASSTGRVRDHNEDRSFAEAPLLAVADGMGGAQAGEVAAQIAIDAVAQVEHPPTAGTLKSRLQDANRQIREAASDDTSRAGMGTTLTAALLEDGAITLMHVGDSRAYLVRNGDILQVTDDHSIVAEMVRRGELQPDAARRHPSRNIITRALGAEPTIEIDEVTVPVQPGDLILLCSDGLSSLVDDATIQRAIRDAGGLQDAAAALVDAALEAGGTDNVTVVLGRVGGQDDAPGATGELPAVEPEPTAPIRITSAPDSPTTGRAPVVLEPTSPARAPWRRAVAVSAVVILLVAAFAVWAASRTYFVDGAPDTTVRVYHGAPFSIGGLDLFAQWADTGVPASAVTARDPDALGRNARGRGGAVLHTVQIVWRYGLTDVPPIEVPPPAPEPAPAPPA